MLGFFLSVYFPHDFNYLVILYFIIGKKNVNLTNSNIIFLFFLVLEIKNKMKNYAHLKKKIYLI
jgi:hypothetical protein